MTITSTWSPDHESILLPVTWNPLCFAIGISSSGQSLYTQYTYYLVKGAMKTSEAQREEDSHILRCVCVCPPQVNCKLFVVFSVPNNGKKCKTHEMISSIWGRDRERMGNIEEKSYIQNKYPKSIQSAWVRCEMKSTIVRCVAGKRQRDCSSQCVHFDWKTFFLLVFFW